MKTVLCALIWGWLVMTCAGAAPARKDADYEKIVNLLQQQIDFLVPSALREEVKPEEILAEGEREWTRTMAQFRRMVASHDAESRKDLTTSKELLHAFWQRKCSVLFDQLKQPEARLRRYDEGVGGSTGYVVTIDGKVKYWLPQRFNRE